MPLAPFLVAELIESPSTSPEIRDFVVIQVDPGIRSVLGSFDDWSGLVHRRGVLAGEESANIITLIAGCTCLSRSASSVLGHSSALPFLGFTDS